MLDSVSTAEMRSSSKKSWGGLKSNKQKHQVEESQTQAVGSLVSGDNLNIQAGRDVQVTASGVVSTKDINILAGRDLTIDTATNTFTRSEKHKVKSRDLTGILTANNLGLDDITGNQHLSISKQNGSGKAEETTLTGSTVGSSEGNLSLTAGRQIAVVASDLVAPKDMTLTASDVTIAAGIETAKQSSKSSATSLAVGRVVGGTLVESAQSIYDNAKAAEKTDDDRLKAVKTAQAVMAASSTVQQAGDTADAVADDKSVGSGGSVIKIGTELAHTRSKSSSEFSAEQVKQSNLNSGGTLIVVASGAEAGSKGDIHIVGSNLKAAETELLAKRDLIMESAQNRADWNNQSKNTRTSVGASFNIGQQNGFTLDLGAKAAIGDGKGREITQVNSQLDTGSLLLVTGQDATLAGAQIHADKVQAAIGGDLNIASRQDEIKSKQEQKSAGFGASICVPPFCYGATVAATANLAAGETSTDYKAVTEQSGIYAGEGGYDITVGDTTRLQGAVIASEATTDKNRLSTDRLEHSDIRNRSEIKSQSASLSVSYSSGGETKSGNAVEGGSSLGSGLPLALEESDRSTTRSAVSEGAIEVRNAAGTNDLDGLSRTTAGANQHLDKPDEKAIQERMDLIQSTAALGQSVVSTISQAKQKSAQEKIEQAQKSNSQADKDAAQAAIAEAAKWDVGGDKRLFADIATGLLAAGLGGTGGGTAVGIVANTTAADTFKRIGDFADQKHAEAKDEATKAAWDEGGVARVLLHATAGALQGLAGGTVEGGALGAGASAALMPAIGKALEDAGLGDDDSKAVATLIATGMGVAVGSGKGTAGQIAAGNAAAGVELYNRQLHPEERELAKRLAEKSGGKYTAEQIEEQLRLTYVNGTDVGPGTDSVVPKNGIYDPSGNWVELGNSGLYLQQMAKLDIELVAFIRQETNAYYWAAFPTAPAVDWSKTPSIGSEKRDRLSGYVLNEQGMYRVPVMIDGQPFSPQFHPCADSECLTIGANIDLNDSETQRWIAAGNAKAAQDAAAIGSLAPLPSPLWLGRILGAIFAKGAVRKSLAEMILERPSSSVWGSLSDGTNQGVKHFVEYWDKFPERIPSIEKRLGLSDGAFAKTVDGFDLFTESAQRVANFGIPKYLPNGKVIYFVEGAQNPRKGVIVIKVNGELQSMMAGDLRAFNKME